MKIGGCLGQSPLDISVAHLPTNCHGISYYISRFFLIGQEDVEAVCYFPKSLCMDSLTERGRSASTPASLFSTVGVY